MCWVCHVSGSLRLASRILASHLSHERTGPVANPPLPHSSVLPQSLPDHLQDPFKFPSRTVSTLNEEDEDTEDTGWQRTVRPAPSLDSPSSARRPAHSRDSSAEKASQPNAPSVASPRAPASHSRGVGDRVPDRVTDPKNAAYGHHRQTSIVHGIQHSRNGSFASTTSSPLSPQLIAAAGAAHERPDMQSVAARLEGELGPSSRSQPNMDGQAHPERAPLERAASAGDLAFHGATQRRLERGQSRPRREHSHRPSHATRNSRDEQKTVGEYALHVLFTSVCFCQMRSCTSPQPADFVLVYRPGRGEA